MKFEKGQVLLHPNKDSKHKYGNFVLITILSDEYYNNKNFHDEVEIKEFKFLNFSNLDMNITNLWIDSFYANECISLFNKRDYHRYIKVFLDKLFMN